jgi:hypothetical protein
MPFFPGRGASGRNDPGVRNPLKTQFFYLTAPGSVRMIAQSLASIGQWRVKCAPELRPGDDR